MKKDTLTPSTETRLSTLPHNPGSSLRAAVVIAALALGQRLVVAHPGHSWQDASPWHLLSSPDHMVVLASSGAALWFAGRFIQRRLTRRIVQGIGLAVAAAGVGMLWALGPS